MTYILQTLQYRFESKFIPEPMSGCFLWISSLDSRGYGRFQWKGKRVRATHVALQLAGRKIPPGHIACHHCDTPACVNPDHLFVGTPRDNTHDMIAKGRQQFSQLIRHGPRKTHCKRGHLRDENNLYRAPDGRAHCKKCRESRRLECVV